LTPVTGCHSRDDRGTRPVDLPFEWTPEHALEPLGNLDERIEIDAGLDALALQQVTRSSVAMLPVARGAYGQPPRPPIDASRTVAPPSSAASAFA
jgi:hypothetical protein